MRETRPTSHPMDGAAAFPHKATTSRSATPRLRPSQRPIGTAAHSVSGNPAVALSPSRVPVSATASGDSIALGLPRDSSARQTDVDHDLSGKVQLHRHAPIAIQPKPTLGQPGDQYEREADSAADAVMRMPDPGRTMTHSAGAPPEGELHREPHDNFSKLHPKDGEDAVRHKESSATPMVARAQSTPSTVQGVLQSGGQPIDATTRSFMEPRFGYDFGSVRVHSDERAAKSARSVNALAYTIGRDVVFGAGQYAPSSIAGKRLLAHELQHVVQNDMCKISRQTADGDTGVPAIEKESEQPPDYVQEVIDACNKTIPDAAGGVGDFPQAFRILSSLSPSDLQATLIELEKRGYVDLLLSNIGVAGADRERLNNALTDVVNARPKAAPASPEKQKADGHQAVAAFRKSAGGQAWPQLSRAAIADGLDQRIDNPSLISQSVLNACGPAAIAYMLASDNPLRFVQIVQALFEAGRASLDGESLAAGPDLRRNTPPAKMAQVDWMLMSSMRDSENAVFDFEGDTSEDFSAITTPSDLTHWMRSILKCPNVSWQSAYISGELDVIRDAGVDFASGKNVALLIDAAMLRNLPKEGKIGIPDHWVVLKSPVTILDEKQGDKVQFSIWTWGESSLRNLNLDKSFFLKTFYGAAVCSL
jgi:Domain of unknown function (DUF4157)